MVTKWHLIGRVHASKYRKKILEELNKNVKTPTVLEKETNIKISHVSRALKELSDLRLVKCLTPDLKKGKMYHITKLGKEVLESIKSWTKI